VGEHHPRNDSLLYMKRSPFLFIVPLLLLAACAAPAASPIPTAYPPEYVPTVVALTAEAANVLGTEVALALTPTVLPSRTPRPTLSPTPQPTFTQTTIPSHRPAAIQIFAPGPMSKVVSPITLRMNIVVGESEKVQIDLYGEDGRLLTRNLKRGVPPSGKGVPQQIRVPFEIRAAAEVGRLTISTTDELGRLQSLNSVRLLLLSSGANEIHPPGDPSEPVGVFIPKLEEEVSGGVLNIRGDVWPFNLNPVILELIGEDGRSMGLRILNLNQLEPQLIETTLPYKVTEPTLARLTIRQDDDRIDGLFYLYSQEVLLNP
jgi:hypothetical protein